MNTITKDVKQNDVELEHEASEHLLQFLHDDNKAVAELFFQFSQAEGAAEKQALFEQIKAGMSVHCEVVDALLYPLVVSSAEEEEDVEEAEELIAVAEAGNYVASILLDELSEMKPDEDYFEAKMTILCELTKAQVKREEKEMFEKLRSADLDFSELAEEAAEMKAGLVEELEHTKTKSTKAKSTKSAKSAKAKATKVTGAKKTAPKAVSKNGKAKKKAK